MNNVLLLTDDMGSGGAERQIAFLAIELKKASHRVRLIRFYGIENHYEAELKKAGVPVETHIKGRAKWRRPYIIRNLITRYNADTVIAYKDGPAMGACLAKLLPGTPFNLIVSERNTTQVLTKKERLKFLLFRLSNHIIPNSHSQTEFIRKFYPELIQKTVTITNMLDTAKFSPAYNQNLNKIPEIITVARVWPQKNVINYLHAIYILKQQGIQCHFSWYGNSEPTYMAQVKNLQQQLCLTDTITFHDAVQDVISVYRSADIFCLPSLYEGFPNVLCEAMSCGLTCLASDICDNPNILTDKTFRFNPEFPNEIAEKLTSVISLTRDERIAKGKANRNRIIELCAPDSFLKKYEMLLNQPKGNL